MAVVLAGAAWQATLAGTPVTVAPAELQVRQTVTAFRDSEAEHAMGSYYPGVGAFFSLDLLRGPNTVAYQPPQRGVRDWMIYLMQTFGPKLDKVPASEQIGISTDFFDYTAAMWRQLAIVAPAGKAGDPGTYKVTLDGGAYTEPAADPGSSAAPGSTDAAASAAPAGGGQATTSAPAGATVFDFNDPANAAAGWTTVGGQWAASDGGYAQTAKDGFDYLAYRDQPTSGDVSIAATIRFVAGSMAAGVLFNAADAKGKAGAEMVSYTGQGTYLQWGYFDPKGAFVFQGGATVPTGADGKPHRLEVVQHGRAFDVAVDGQTVGTAVPVVPADGHYAGLFDSTSSVVFDDVAIGGLSGSAASPAASAAPSASAAPASSGTPASTAAPGPAASGAPSATPAPAASADPSPSAATGATQPVSLTLSDTASAASFAALSGTWTTSADGYEQTAVGLYDCIALNTGSLAGNYRVEVKFKSVSGEMGAGLVFAAPNPATKAGAMMVGLTGHGTYLQWGAFDSQGVFGYKGGASIPSVADGKWHTLAVHVTGTTYNIALDDAAVATKAQLLGSADGYAGLFDSLGDVVFATYKVTVG